MKSKVLVSSILTIALCLSLIAGSTFALFTDQSKFGIEVTSGDVEIYASAAIFKVWSAQGAANDVAEDEYLEDENGHGYNHVDPKTVVPGIADKTFINGGNAEINSDGKLVINRITPGDKVDVTVKVDNKSDVAMVYRYKIIAEDKNLAYGMVVSVQDEASAPVVAYEGLATWTSKWYPVIPAVGGTPTEIPDYTFSVELPVYAGNEYQSEKEDQEDGRLAGAQSVSYTVLVEAVQGNAVTDDESQATLFPEAFARRAERGGVLDGQGATVTLENALAVAGKDLTIVNTTIDATDAADFGSANLALYAQQADIVLGEGTTLIAGDDYGIFGMFMNNITLDKGSKIVVPEGSNASAITVQGMNGALNLYLNDTGLIEGDTMIVLMTSSEYNIYVPSAEAYNEYVDMIETDTTAKEINWYIDGELVPVATDDASLQAALADPNVPVVRLGANVTAAIADLSNKVIDACGNDATLTFTGKLENVVIMGIVDTDGISGASTIDLSAATGDVAIVGCTLTDMAGTPNGAIRLATNTDALDVTIDNCVVSSNGKGYGAYHSGQFNGDITVTNTTFKNVGSWAIQINNKIVGDVKIDNCTFENVGGVVKVLSGIEGDFTFTNNTMISPVGHDGKPEQIMVSTSKNTPVSCTGTKTVTGNTLDGADWTQN
jgi:predicted ribosomally synthesized peptide with SipW-like signal peptide